jgi:tetratricopeptide (TPR) repeat protein
MSRRLYTSLFFIAFISFSSSAVAQDVNEYYTKAKKFINKSKLDSATFYLSKALELAPDNLEILEDLLYVQYLDRDFVKAVSLGKNLISRADAGVKTFQLVGMTYKEIAEFKEAKKVYDKALLKFPSSGMLYSEYADLLSEMQKPAEAIKLWEKGIEVDPGFNSNYYYATKYYSENNNPVWGMIYGETFVNIESYTDRTTEIKEILAELYKKISTPGFLTAKGNVFAQTVVTTFFKQPPIPLSNLNVQSLTLMRMNFMNDWNKENNAKFPFKLFEYHNQLIKEGLFDAYNQWLFSSLNPETYEAWKLANKEKQAAFQNFVGGRVYKIPAGQYYQTK